jgi:hypothetical protein
MVLTAAQTTAFFEGATQMGILNAMVVQLVNQGISEVDDLSEFDRNSLQQVADNLRQPGGRIPEGSYGWGGSGSNNPYTTLHLWCQVTTATFGSLWHSQIL